jgi:hypothetical protein
MTDGEVRNPLEYWANRQHRYPRLSKMAMDFLTIQPMSAEYDRVFSSAGKMITFDRGRLDAATIGICQVLRSWYMAGVLPKDDTKWAPIKLDAGDDDGNGNSDGEDLLLEDDESDTSEIDTE